MSNDKGKTEVVPINEPAKDGSNLLAVIDCLGEIEDFCNKKEELLKRVQQRQESKLAPENVALGKSVDALFGGRTITTVEIPIDHPDFPKVKLAFIRFHNDSKATSTRIFLPEKGFGYTGIAGIGYEVYVPPKGLTDYQVMTKVCLGKAAGDGLIGKRPAVIQSYDWVDINNWQPTEPQLNYIGNLLKLVKNGLDKFEEN